MSLFELRLLGFRPRFNFFGFWRNIYLITLIKQYIRNIYSGQKKYKDFKKHYKIFKLCPISEIIPKYGKKKGMLVHHC